MSSNFLCLTFNHAKSHCTMFGKCCSHHIETMLLGDKTIDWVKSVKYLVCILSVVLNLASTLQVPSAHSMPPVIAFIVMLKASIILFN